MDKKLKEQLAKDIVSAFIRRAPAGEDLNSLVLSDKVNKFAQAYIDAYYSVLGYFETSGKLDD